MTSVHFPCSVLAPLRRSLGGQGDDEGGKGGVGGGDDEHDKSQGTAGGDL